MSEQKEFERSLEQATLKMIQDMAGNMELACLVIERDAKKNCSVDMGTLRASISHDVDFKTDSIVGSVFSNLDYAPFLEKGTGIYAVDGNGRQDPWVYVKGEHSGVKSNTKKVYTWEEALRVMAILQRKGIDAHATKGQKPHPFLEPARDSNKDKITEILAGKNK